MMTRYNRIIGYVLLFNATILSAHADDPKVVDASAKCNEGGICRFDVSVLHGDTGWDHYVNRWDVLTADGQLLGTRELLHPHENEQPFTRSLSGVALPAGTVSVIVRVYDSVHGQGTLDFVIPIAGE